MKNLMEEKVEMQTRLIKLAEGCKKIEEMYKLKTMELLKVNQTLK